MDKTRALIIQRIEEIKELSSDCVYDGFDKRNGRWSRLFVDDTHISEVDFSAIDLYQLVHIFEHIVRRYYTQR